MVNIDFDNGFEQMSKYYNELNLIFTVSQIQTVSFSKTTFENFEHPIGTKIGNLTSQK